MRGFAGGVVLGRRDVEDHVDPVLDGRLLAHEAVEAGKRQGAVLLDL